MTRVCFISQLQGDESPYATPGNDCRAWAYVLGGDTRNFHTILREPEQLGAYDVAIVELTANAYSVVPFIRERAPRITLVGLVEGGVEALADQAPWEQLMFLEAVAVVDLLGVLVESALPYYRLVVIDQRRAQWLGVPYPKAWTDAVPLPPAGDRQRVIELSAGLERGRNGVATLLLTRQLQERYPDVRPRVYATSAAEFHALRRLNPACECCVQRAWPDYYAHHVDSYAALSLDPRRSWGRFVLDCAAARIPYVGSAQTHCGSRLALLTCDPFDVESAYGHLCRLLDDNELYADVARRQYERLDEFAEEPSRERFWGALAAVGA